MCVFTLRILVEGINNPPHGPNMVVSRRSLRQCFISGRVLYCNAVEADLASGWSEAVVRKGAHRNSDCGVVPFGLGACDSEHPATCRRSVALESKPVKGETEGLHRLFRLMCLIEQ